MKRSNDPVRILMAGCGNIAAAHLAAFDRHPEALVLAAVVDPSAAAARTVAGSQSKRCLVETFASLEEALEATRGRVDAALVLSPHFLHAKHAALCLERGLPVLVEKPATCTVDELRRLREIEERTGAFVQVGQVQRFGVLENRLGAWLRSAEFGEPRLFNLDTYQNVQGYVSDKPGAWILDGRLAGGGVVVSVAVHILDLLRFWFEDDFVEVFACGRFDPPFVNGAESQCTATLRTRRGVTGTLNASYTTARTPYSQRSLIFGTHGTLAQHMEVIGGGYAGAYYVATDGGRPSPRWDMMYSGFEPVAEKFGEPPGNPFAAQLLAFAEGVRSGRAVENSIARNFNTLAVIEAIGASMRSGKSELVPTE